MSTTDESPAPATTKGKDRSMVPTFALLVSCVLSAYGFSRKIDLWSYYVPGGLILASLLWAAWPRLLRTRS
jgi:hypothetical protein